jgi:hypothetical protein
MVAGQGEVHRVVDQVAQLDALVKALELRLREVAELEHERYLELGSAQHLHRLLWLLLGEVELHLRVATLEEGHGRWQQGRPCAREGRQAHAAAANTGDRLQLCLGGTQAGDDHLGVLHEGAPGVRKAHPAAAAVHERGARSLLEGRDLLRDGGLRIGEGVGGRRERSVLRNRPEDPQLLDIEHN